MNYAAAQKWITEGRQAPVYVLSGEELYLIRKMEEKILQQLLPGAERQNSLQQFDKMPSLKDLEKLLAGQSFFAERQVFLIRDGSLFKAKKESQDSDCKKKKKEGNGENWEDLIQTIPAETHLIFSFSGSADKRKKLYKLIDKVGLIVEADYLKHWELKDWIQQYMHSCQRSLAPAAVEYFLSLVSLMPHVSLEYVQGELEKAILYAGEKRELSLDILKQSVIKPQELSIFALLDSIALRQRQQALQLLSDELARGESPIKLLALLAKQFRQLWRIKLVGTEGMSLHPFLAKKMTEQSGKISTDTLRQALCFLADADYKLKFGQADAFILQEFVIRFSSQK